MEYKQFKEILVKQIKVLGRNFSGSDKEKKESLEDLVGYYFLSLSYLSETELDSAFLRCRESYSYFPSIHQVLKCAPVKRQKETFVRPKFVPVRPEMQNKVNSVLNGPKKPMTKQQMIKNFKFLHKRNPFIDWRPIMERELEKLS